MKRLLMPVVVLTLIMPGLVLAQAKPEKTPSGGGALAKTLPGSLISTLSEVFVVVNDSGPEAAAGAATVLRACRTLVGGDAHRILDAGSAYEEQFRGSLRTEEPVGEEATKKARWLRDWLLQRVQPGGTLVLVGDQRALPTWHVRLGSVNCTIDSFYTDLDGNGIPETAVSRILGTPEQIVRQIEGKRDYGRKAAILCSEDTRIHLETRAFAKTLSRRGYEVAICGNRSEEVLAASDLIIHFGHGSPAVIANRFGEPFVSAGNMPVLKRSPVVLVDGCGTLPVGSPLLRAFLEQGALAYIGSTETVQGMIPARFTNELVEHFLRILDDQPQATLPQVLTAARAAYVQGHPGLAETLRQLALTGEVDRQGAGLTDALTVAEWVYYGDPKALLPRAAEPQELCHETLSLSQSVPLDEGNRSWRCSFPGQRDGGQAVLALYADLPLRDAVSFQLSVRQNGKPIADLDSHHDTIYQNLGRECRGGYACNETYRARFLVPFDASAGKQEVEVCLESGSSACLTPGTAIDVWPADFEKRIGLKRAPDLALLRPAMRPPGQKPVKVTGVAKLYPTDRAGFLSLDLSSVFNRPHNSVQVGGGDNASFKTWFAEDVASTGGTPFHVGRKGNDVLVSANNTENEFEITGFAAQARRLHLLLWGYNNPRQSAHLAISFKDGGSQTFDLPLSEWTRVEAPMAFDFENTVPVFRHAAVAHQVVEVNRPKQEIVSISSSAGTYGLIAITLEE
jgi:hypothetical protein